MFEKDVHVITGESGILETDAKDAYIPTNISNSVAIHRNNGLYYIGNPYIVDNEYREERNAINPLSGDYISLVQYVPIRNSAMIRTDYGFNDEWDSTSTPNNFVVESNQIPSVYYIPSQGGWYGELPPISLPWALPSTKRGQRKGLDNLHNAVVGVLPGRGRKRQLGG